MIKAVIFDMDGVISDTNFLLADIERELLKKHQVNLATKDISADFAGMKDEEFFKAVIKDISDKEVKILVEEKWRLLLQKSPGQIKAIAGIKELVANLYKNNFKLAVASASRQSFIELVLKELDIREKFDILLSAEEVAKGKPSPDIFLLAAKKLGIKAVECLVIEDGHNGMLAAQAANMKCIGLKSEVEDKYPTDIVVSSLDQITIELIKNL